MNRFVMSAAILALGLVACGDDADKPAVGTNVSTNNTAVNNTAVNNTAVNNTAVNNTSVNNTTANNVAPNNVEPNNSNPSNCGEPNAEASLGLEAEAALPRGFEDATDVSFYRGIAYGPDEKNAFDIFVPASDTATPLVIYIHGGGFTAGSREAGYANPQAARSFLDEGIAYASISYRLLEANETEGVIKSLKDSRRALQFIRQHAADFNVDPDRIALAGTSAGAGTALWIGLGDEACVLGAADPTEAISTRVQGIAALETQASYDLRKWETDVFADDYPLVTLENVVALNAGFYAVIGQFYGLEQGWMNLADLAEEPLVSYRAEVDMLAMADATDPPLYVWNDGPSSMPADLGSLLHHPLHAEAVYEAAVAGGVARAELKTQEREEGTATNWATFLVEVL